MQSVVTKRKMKNKRRKKLFFAFNYDRVFKSVFCSEEVRRKEDFHLLERLISDIIKERIKVIKIMSPELAVTSTRERTKRLDLLIESHGKVVHMELNTSWNLENKIRNNCFFFSFYSQNTKVGENFDTNITFIHISLNYGMGKNDNLIIDTNNLSSEYKKILPNIRMLHVNLDNYKRIWYDNVAKENMEGSLLTLISLKSKEDIKRYAESVDDQDVKECAKKLMILNENTIKSFWNLTPEQENRMMQNTRENIIRERSEARGLKMGKAEGKLLGKNEEKIAIAKNMIKRNMNLDIIKDITRLSEKEIKKLIDEK